MPTSYTAMIDEDPKLSTAKWMTEGLARNFGVCAVIRDHDRNLAEDEIEEHLKNMTERGTKYHREKLVETQEILKKLNSEGAWRELYRSAMDKRAKSNAQSIGKANTIRIRHQQVKEDLIKLRDNTKDEVTRNIAEFGLSQLEAVKPETEPCISAIPNLKEFKSIKLAALNWNIAYHTREIEKTEKQGAERLSIYQKIRSEVAEILG